MIVKLWWCINHSIVKYIPLVPFSTLFLLFLHHRPKSYLRLRPIKHKRIIFFRFVKFSCKVVLIFVRIVGHVLVPWFYLCFAGLEYRTVIVLYFCFYYFVACFLRFHQLLQSVEPFIRFSST